MKAPRRMMLRAMLGLGMLGSGLRGFGTANAATGTAESNDDPHAALDARADLVMEGSERIAMLAYEDMTALDLVGPQYFFASLMGAKVEIVSTRRDRLPLRTDTALAITPDLALEEAHGPYDVLFVPGGTIGTVAAMRDARVLEWLREQAPSARLVTSVCTGALVLGRAGLLEGRRATTHWAAMEVLPALGATPVSARTVQDGNLITGAGVSAGLDLGLAVVAQLRGAGYAKAVQLQAEYAPAPPFMSGHPDEAAPELTTMVEGLFGPAISAFHAAARG